MGPVGEENLVRDDNLVEAKRRERLVRKRSVARRFTLANLLINGLLAAGKAVVGVLTGSLAITADAFNSLADTAYSVVLVVGMRFSLQPADRRHPQGHRGLEPLISLVIGVSIAVVAYQLVVRGVRGLGSPPDLAFSILPILVLLGSMAAKTWIFVEARRSADKIHSPALRATGNDALADVFASSAALVGYIGAVAGWSLADPVFSLVVAVFIVRTVYEVLWENVGYIVGRSAPPEIEKQVLGVACRPAMVKAVHDLKAFHLGPELHVSFHIEVDREETLEDVHELEQRVRLLLLDMPEIDDVAVHVDPVRTAEGTVCHPDLDSDGKVDDTWRSDGRSRPE